MQNILELEDGNSVLKLTVASYLRPSGKNIHRFKTAKETDEWGVTPNPGLEVKLTPEQYIAYARNRIKRDLLTSKRNRKATDAAKRSLVRVPLREGRTPAGPMESQPRHAASRARRRPCTG